MRRGVTRSHVVFDHAKGSSRRAARSRGQTSSCRRGALSIIGGKLTTYLNLSRQTVDVVFEKLDRKAPKSRSRKVPLPGSETSDFEAFAAGFKSASTIPEVLSGRLLKLYGVRAAEVLKIGEEDPELLTPLLYRKRRDGVDRGRGDLGFPRGDGPDALRRTLEALDGRIRPKGRPRRRRRRRRGRRQTPRMGKGARRTRSARVPRVDQTLHPQRAQGSRNLTANSCAPSAVRKEGPPESSSRFSRCLLRALPVPACEGLRPQVPEILRTDAQRLRQLSANLHRRIDVALLYLG